MLSWKLPTGWRKEKCHSICNSHSLYSKAYIYIYLYNWSLLNSVRYIISTYPKRQKLQIVFSCLIEFLPRPHDYTNENYLKGNRQESRDYGQELAINHVRSWTKLTFFYQVRFFFWYFLLHVIAIKVYVIITRLGQCSSVVWSIIRYTESLCSILSQGTYLSFRFDPHRGT